MGQMNCPPRVWCSMYFFFHTFYRLRAPKTLYFYLYFFWNKQIDWKYFCKEFCKKSWKKIILGTSDAWSTIHLAHRPSDPAYYIVNWLISGFQNNFVSRNLHHSRQRQVQEEATCKMKLPWTEYVARRRGMGWFDSCILSSDIVIWLLGLFHCLLQQA